VFWEASGVRVGLDIRAFSRRYSGTFHCGYDYVRVDFAALFPKTGLLGRREELISSAKVRIPAVRIVLYHVRGAAGR
jgi:hypothetical protein